MTGSTVLPFLPLGMLLFAISIGHQASSLEFIVSKPTQLLRPSRDSFPIPLKELKDNEVTEGLDTYGGAKNVADEVGDSVDGLVENEVKESGTKSVLERVLHYSNEETAFEVKLTKSTEGFDREAYLELFGQLIKEDMVDIEKLPDLETVADKALQIIKAIFSPMMLSVYIALGTFILALVMYLPLTIVIDFTAIIHLLGKLIKSLYYMVRNVVLYVKEKKKLKSMSQKKKKSN